MLGLEGHLEEFAQEFSQFGSATRLTPHVALKLILQGPSQQTDARSAVNGATLRT